ncbi:glutamate--tRNA ligase [Bernardetia sp.]|uniref:glutamate--tRNA ligase n=1 Tax=Bernardetia sp. TaxID=1937974 RepID=UPI0025C16DE7|nr:glutamate--tRNA ligase [Bernardetia sp.]
MSKDTNVRVRFAPSPTGALHIGGVRTALFNYLFAKKHGGEFIVRIEDTDQTRFVEGAEEYIMEALEWVGISPTESPKHGGEYAPYRQSERKDMYKDYAMQLVEKGHAYYAFDTSEELEAMKERLKNAGVASPQYNSITRTQMRNSLTLPEDETKKLLENGTPYVIRLKIPRKEEVRLNDMIRSWVVVHSSAIDDKVLLKSDGMPTYHLANVVDDHLMKITHVIRGEEWLPSAPLHVLLYRYLGWEDTMPRFAHLPLILKPDGNGKLSKRDGAKFGMPVFPLEWNGNGIEDKFEGFREWGFESAAVVNFLALLGWNPGNNEEIFSMEELIEKFDIARVNKAGARFDFDKAKWFNQQYLRNKPNSEIADYLASMIVSNSLADRTYLEKLAEMLKERAVFLSDFWEGSKVFLQAPSEYDEQLVAKKWNADAVKGLSALVEILKNTDSLEDETQTKQLVNDAAKNAGVKMGAVMLPLRLSLTGAGSGPDLMEIAVLLGKEEVIHRIEKAIDELEVKA